MSRRETAAVQAMRQRRRALLNGIDSIDALHRVQRDELWEIQCALARVERGTWGVCERCGQRVERGRLTAQPWARVCGSCEHAREHARGSFRAVGEKCAP